MHNRLDYLFVVNPVSGNGSTNWEKEICRFFETRKEVIDFIILHKDVDESNLTESFKTRSAEKVVAVGGDGTVKLLASLLKNTGIPLGLLPGGSANGMARELGIANGASDALEMLVNSHIEKIDLIRINDEISIHLSDIGLNAALIRHFEKYPTRGWFTYAKALWKALKAKNKFRCTIKTDTELLHRRAYMVVIANATKYGMGAVINPVGGICDGRFEVIVVRKLNFFAILNAFLKGKPFHHEKVEVLQTKTAKISIGYKQHFQVDGEYLGKQNRIDAEILPGALRLMLPPDYGTGF